MLYLPSSSDELGTKPATWQRECDTGRLGSFSERGTRTRIVRFHEAERPVVDGDGEQAEVVRVADAWWTEER